MPERVDPLAFARKFAALLGRIVERAASRAKLEEEDSQDFAEIERIMGKPIGRAAITLLTEPRVICPRCDKDVAESEMHKGACVNCQTKVSETRQD